MKAGAVLDAIRTPCGAHIQACRLGGGAAVCRSIHILAAPRKCRTHCMAGQLLLEPHSCADGRILGFGTGKCGMGLIL